MAAKDQSEVTRLTKDLAAASTTLSDSEARFLVDSYYMMQDNRIRAAGQVRALSKSGEPHQVLTWLTTQSRTLEDQIKRSLDKYSLSRPLGRWARSNYGIGPVITAGLLGNIDMTKATTAGHIWSFAGLDPTAVWLPKTRRPWNASLKTLCWKAGESFVKFSGHEDCHYGHIWQKRRKLEISKNMKGDYSVQAGLVLEKKRIGPDTEAYQWLIGKYPAFIWPQMEGLALPQRAELLKSLKGHKDSIPMLPPAHIHARAKRYAVKLFLAHYHEMGYKLELGSEPPLPYPIAILNHDIRNKIEPFVDPDE
jgi:hypothetical protein